MKQHMTRAEWRRLEDYISKNCVEIDTVRPSRERLAETASKILGFPVNASQVAQAAGTMGIKLKRAKPVFRAIPDEQEIAVIARFLIRIAADLGVEIPNDVREVARE